MDKISKLFLQTVACGLERNTIEDPGLSEREWKDLMQLSIEHTLLPVVFEAVYSVMPADLEKEYRAISLAWISEQIRITEEFLKLYREMKRQGIEPLVFKGIVCRDAYTLSDWRISSDEDVYIDRSEYMKFHALMKKSGFAGYEPNFHSEHETIYQRKELRIEGHWELFPKENRLWVQMNALKEEMLNRAGYLGIGEVEILTLEPTDHMIYLLFHTMKHFALAGVGVRQICDIVQWDKKYTVDWTRVKAVMEALGGSRFSAAILDAGCRYFGMDLPEGWEAVDSTDLIEDSLKGGIFGHSTEERRRSASITLAAGEEHNKVYSLLRAAFPKREAMEINYPWVSCSRFLLPVGWGVRFFRYISRIGKDNSPLRSIEIGMQRMKLLKEYDVFQD